MLKTLLILGRVSNLPTVWSNCPCAWILTEANDTIGLIWILIGTSFMYLGGMFLNDYCDVQYDNEHRPERPIPSGLISRKNVFIISIVLLVGGFAVMAHIKLDVMITSMVLLTLIVCYNIIHKTSPRAPFIMAACRADIYLIVAALTGLTHGHRGRAVGAQGWAGRRRAYRQCLHA